MILTSLQQHQLGVESVRCTERVLSLSPLLSCPKGVFSSHSWVPSHLSRPSSSWLTPSTKAVSWVRENRGLQAQAPPGPSLSSWPATTSTSHPGSSSSAQHADRTRPSPNCSQVWVNLFGYLSGWVIGFLSGFERLCFSFLLGSIWWGLCTAFGICCLVYARNE